MFARLFPGRLLRQSAPHGCSRSQALLSAHTLWQDRTFVSESSQTGTATGSTYADQAPVSLIQGASRGLGLEFVRQLLEDAPKEATGRQGGKVLATCRDPTGSPGLQALKDQYPDRLHLLRLDVTDTKSLEEAAEAARALVGRLDLLVNVTGILHTAQQKPETSLAKVSAENLLRSYHINAVGPVMVTQAFSGLLRSTATARARAAKAAGASAPAGPPVVVASLSARVSSIGDNRLGGWHSYRASKCALNMLNKNMAIELGRAGSHVTCILLHPGTVDTDLSKPFQKNVKPEKLFTRKFSVSQMLKIIGQVGPEDTGKLYAWDGQVIQW